MIKNLWYAVLSSEQVPRNKPVGFMRLGERMVFWRDDAGKAHCFFDKCAHRGASLALGDIVDGHVRCPFHGLEYDVTGRCVKIPANGRNAPVPEAFKMRSYLVHEAYGWIFIWWGDGAPTPAEPMFFDDLKGFKHWATVQDPWDNHYTRVAENQLDVAHLPFVHRTTIGRGNRTLIEGPGFQWKADDLFFVYVYNRLDDGRKPRSVDEVPVPDPTRDYKLEFILPNMWQNRISDKLRIAAAFVPVDEEHAILYLRWYQSFMLIPPFSWIIDGFGLIMSLVIAHQDRRVVNTQLPKGDGIGKGETLFPGDKPIMEFRRRRQALRQRPGSEVSN